MQAGLRSRRTGSTKARAKQQEIRDQGLKTTGCVSNLVTEKLSAHYRTVAAAVPVPGNCGTRAPAVLSVSDRLYWGPCLFIHDMKEGSSASEDLGLPGTLDNY